MFPKQFPCVVVLVTPKRAISARLTGRKQLISRRAELVPKIVMYVTQRNGPILGAETDLFVLQYSHGCSRGKVGVKLKYNFQSKNRLKMQTYVLCSPRGLIRLNMQSKKFLQPEFCSKISMIICAVFDDRHS